MTGWCLGKPRGYEGKVPRAWAVFAAVSEPQYRSRSQTGLPIDRRQRIGYNVPDGCTNLLPVADWSQAEIGYTVSGVGSAVFSGRHNEGSDTMKGATQ